MKKFRFYQASNKSLICKNGWIDVEEINFKDYFYSKKFSVVEWIKIFQKLKFDTNIQKINIVYEEWKDVYFVTKTEEELTYFTLKYL